MDNKIDTDNSFYRTDDLLISSFLLCRQAQLQDIVSDSPRHFSFVFQDSIKCRELVKEYLNNGLVSARELFARREELMNAIRGRNGRVE